MADIIGDNGNNTLDGTDDDDLIQGLGGNDVINGNGGNDRIEGGFGNNTLTGGAGNDVFAIVERGNQVQRITDFTVGEDKIDLSILGVGSFAQLIPFLTQNSDEALFQTIWANRTESIVFEDLDRGDLSEDDFIFFTDLAGQTLDFSANSSNYTLFGANGDDTISDSQGNDTVSGGAGNDTFLARGGSNTFYLGDGNDIFALSERRNQIHTVEDFELGEDVFDVSFLGVSTFEDLSLFLSQQGDDVRLRTIWANREEATFLRDVDLADLSADNFIFNTSTDSIVIDQSGFSSNYTLFGGAGDDRFELSSGSSTVVAGAGDDRIILDSGTGASIYLGDGADTVFSGNRGNKIAELKDFDADVDVLDVRDLNVGDLETLMPFLTDTEDGAQLRTIWANREEVILFEGLTVADLTADNFRFNTFPSGIVIDQSNNSSNYTLFGGNGDDEITAGSGNDSLNGGAGDDELSAGGGTNTVRTGSGEDTVLFELRGSQVTTILDFTVGEDTFDVRGLNVGDFTTLSQRLEINDEGDAELRTAYGGREEIFIFVGVGEGELSASDFRFNTNDAGLTVSGTNSNDSLFGGNGDDTINGNRGNDTIRSGAGDDVLNGGDGNDRFLGGEGADTMDGGAGTDRILYLNNTTGIVLDLEAGTVSGGDADGDTFTNIEGADGSAFADVMSGTDAANVFNGVGGDDVINALGGNNTVSGGDGDDTITAGNGNNTLNGDAGNDNITVGDGDNTITAGAGNDTIAFGTGENDIDAGDGNDVVTGITGITGEFDVSLGAGDDVATVEGGARLFGGVRASIDGGEGNDTITAGQSVNIEGGDGNDTLIYDSSNDVIGTDGTVDFSSTSRFDGGAGDDLIDIGSADFIASDGGDGNDTLVVGAVQAIGGTRSFFQLAYIVDGPNGPMPFATQFFRNFETLRIDVRGDLRDYVLGEDFQATDENAQFTEASELIQVNAASFGDEYVVSAAGGDDYVMGSGSDDRVFGQNGNDVLIGNNGDDQLFGDDFAPIPSNTIESQVFRAYQAVFDRAPDEGGFNAFVAEVRLGRLTQEQVITDFVTSPEFAALYGELTNREFVEQLYRNVLDREGDADGINAFTAALDDGATRAAVVIDFANSPEFIANTQLSSAAFANTVVINPVEGDVYRAYQGVFGRDPDLGGFELFTSAIAIGVLDIEGVVTDFVGSPEFQDTYGSLSNTNFIELLYDNVLPGNEDPVGRAAFVDALDSGALTRPQVVVQFIQSFEFRQATDVAAEEFARNIFDAVGNDILDGGVGDDTLFGGRGDDLFVTGNGADTILDFTVGEDRIDLTFLGEVTDTFAEIMLGATQEGLDTLLDYGNGNTVLLNNVTMTDLTEDDFVIPVGTVAAEPPKAEARVIAETPATEVAPVETPIYDWMLEDFFV